MDDLVDIRDLIAQFNGLSSLNVFECIANVCSSIYVRSVAGQLGLASRNFEA